MRLTAAPSSCASAAATLLRWRARVPLIHSSPSFIVDDLSFPYAARRRPAAPQPGRGEEDTQEEAPGTGAYACGRSCREARNAARTSLIGGAHKRVRVLSREVLFSIGSTVHVRCIHAMYFVDFACARAYACAGDSMISLSAAFHLFLSLFPELQSPNSFFMDVRCSGCMQITTVFSHATNVRICTSALVL